MDRITLGNEEFEGRNNAYVLTDGDALAVIDTGIATDRTRAELRTGLADLGYEFADVDTVALTHWHPDHAGLAGEIQDASDAVVYAHEADAPLVERDPDAFADLQRRRREYFDEWGMPEDAREELLAFRGGLDAEGIGGSPAAVEPIADGDRLGMGDTSLEVLHAPGHAAGLCCFETSDGREAFVGDAVLPVYTPNVGGADVRVERPLARYLETLRTIADRDYDRLWPGHRDPIDDPTGRALDIVDHHRERTERIVDVLRENGPADAWTVSSHLFGDLAGIHIMHGPGEAYAHLDHLRREGIVEADDGVYYPPDDGVDVEAVLASAE